jgi:protocatechuate 3,4-dioxygenase beta subunit
MKDYTDQPLGNWTFKGLVIIVIISLLVGLAPPPPLHAQPSSRAQAEGPESNGAVSGDVYAADGVTPLAGARVWAELAGEGEGGGETATDGSGHYTIADLPPGQYKIGAEKDGYIWEFYQDTGDWDAATPVEVNDGQTTPGINFTLETAYLIGGHVYHSGSPVADVEVNTGREDWGTGFRTDASGAYTLTVPAGTWELHAGGGGYIYRGWTEVTVPPDRMNVDIEVEPAYTISGRTLYDGSPVSEVEVNTGEEGWGTGTRSEAGGVYTLTVPAGTWELNAQGAGYVYRGGAAVTVPPSSTGMDIELEESGSISGRVTDGDGNPIANLHVQVHDYDTDEGWGGVNTDATGVYTITGLISGDYRVQTCTDCVGPDEPALNYVNEFYDDTPMHHLASRVTVNAPQTTAGIDFELEEGGAITGRVTDGDGNPIANLRVQANDYDGGEWGGEVSTDATGVYTITGLASGDYRVQTCTNCVGPDEPALNYVNEFYDDTPMHHLASRVTVNAPQTTAGIDFELEGGGAITGVVTAPDMVTPIPEAWVEVHTEQWSIHQGSNTDQNGVFHVGGLPDGTYTLEARAPWESHYGDSVPQEVIVVSGQTRDVGTVPLSEPQLQGQVTLPDGTTPVPDAWVEAHSEDWSINRGSNTDQNGVFHIGGLPNGVYTLEARAPWGSDYSDSIPQAVTVSDGPTTDVGIIRLSEPQLRGRVTLPDGSTPVPNAWVDAHSWDWMTSKGASTDDGGYFAIGGLVEGTYYLRAHPPGDGPHADYAPSIEVEVSLGSEPITLTEPIRLQQVNVTGRVVDPDGNPVCCTGVDVHTFDHTIHEGTGTNDQGQFAFGGLPVGDYKIEIHVPWGIADWVSPEPRTFSISDPGSTVDLGDLAFLRASKYVQGAVVRDSDGSGVPNVEVNANRRDGMGWAHTQTDDQGGFSLGVSGGSWELMIHPQGGQADWVYDGHSLNVTFADDASPETSTVTFTVQTPDARVIGEVRGPNGEPLNPWTVWIEVRDQQGMGNGGSIDGQGTFNVPVMAGSYNVWLHVDEWQYPTWGSPEIAPIAVASGETYDLGTLNLIAKNSFITGRVTRESDGQGVPGVDVDAWRPMGMGWAHTTSAADGSYSLAVNAGEWEIGVHVPYTTTYVIGQPPQRVSVGEDEIKSGVDFQLQEADGTIEGMVVDEEGNVLTDVYGWAYARQGQHGPPVAGAPLENGRFTIFVPAGMYSVGVGLPPNSDYTPAGEVDVDISSLGAKVAALDTRQAVAAAYRERTEQQVFVTAGGTQEVNITLLPNNARIVGRFFEDMEKTIPVTGLEGEVFAMGGMDGAWRGTYINPNDGTYELNVAAGTWNLGYWLMSDEYVNSPPPDSRVTIEAGEIFTMNFTLAVADSIIQGHLLEPDGSPLNYGFAWAHRERTETSASIDTGDDSEPPDGYFMIHVPAGEYEVGGFAPEELGYIQPEFQQVTVSPSSPATVNLRFRASNGVIEGTVFYHDEAGNDVYGPWVWVWAWSENGAHTGTVTDEDGHYQLNVITGTVWHLGANYQYDDSLFYDTMQDYVVDMTGPTATQDMEILLSETKLPDALTVYFDASSPILIALDDGTEINIPAGALAVTGTVKIVVTPLVEELPNTLTARPFGYGYAIHAFDSSGRQITSYFNQNVTIAFYYSEDEMRKRGVSEHDLSPAYFSTTTNSWTKVESYTVDKVNNRLTAQINHFSVWAMTTSQGKGGAYQIFLPLVLR